MQTTQLNIDSAEIYTCKFALDGVRALVGLQRNPVGLWDLTTGDLVRTFEHTGKVWALAWSEDQKTMLSLDGKMRLWDVETGECLREFDGHHERCLAWSPDQKRSLTASNDILQLTDLESGQRLFEMKGHNDGIYCAAFDSVGERALSGSRDGTVRVWDLKTGSCIRVLEAHTYHVHGVAWAADENHAVSCSLEVRLWDIENGECLRVFNGHTDTIRTVQWSRDQRQLLSAAHDGTARLWDVETGECLHVFEKHPVGVVSATFSDDQQQVLSCDWNGGIWVRDLGRFDSDNS